MKGMIVVLILGLGHWASAQERSDQGIHRAIQVFAVAAAADSLATGIGLQRGTIHEANPALAWAHDSPVLTVGTAVAVDMLGVWALRRWIAPRHPRLVKVLLYGQAVWRAGMVVKNVQIQRGPHDLR